MTNENAMDFLEYSSQFGSVLGLDSIKELLNRLGNPQNKLKFVHIGGTNGKGSTASFIATILAYAGYKVGRFTSPYVFEYKEIIQISQGKEINGSIKVVHKYIEDKSLSECIKTIQIVCETMVQDGLPHPTTFEIETAMAMLYFLKEKCDLVVLEVGLGGRLDATNVVTKTECTVLTAIGMDHMSFLGNRLEDITKEKVGIIKPGVPVISYSQMPEAKKIIKSTCIQMNTHAEFLDFCDIHIKSMDLEGTLFAYQHGKKVYDSLFISLLGENQVKNAVVAILTMEALIKKGYHVSREDIRNGLYQTRWRGRFEVIHSKPTIVVDGAHNENASKALAKNLRVYFPNKKMIFIIGVLKDKDYTTIIKDNISFAEQIITITPNNARGLSSSKLAHIVQKFHTNVVDGKDISNALTIAKKYSNPDTVIIIFGSLSFLKDVYGCLPMNFT